MKMAVGAVKMQPPPAESPEPAEPGASGAAGAPGGRRRPRRAGSPGAPEPPQPPEPQLRHRLRDLPALLRSGLTLRRKRSAGGGGGRALSRRISNPYLEHTASQIYGENSSCAGRALRNIFTVQASDLIKDRVNLKGVYRRSCVGSELVDWLLENCPFVQCRSMAVGVWQLLLDMGIILSVDHQLYFQDTYVFYQFSSEECSYLYCEYERAEEWQNGVRLLLQLVPLSPARADDCDLPHQKIEDTEESSDELLVRLTSAVQRELAAVIAFKARKAALDQDEESENAPTAVSEDDRLSDSQAGVMCKLQERDDIGRIELVQKLARENCQFLQTDRKEQEKSEQMLPSGIKHGMLGLTLEALRSLAPSDTSRFEFTWLPFASSRISSGWSAPCSPGTTFCLSPCFFGSFYRSVTTTMLCEWEVLNKCSQNRWMDGWEQNEKLRTSQNNHFDNSRLSTKDLSSSLRLGGEKSRRSAKIPEITP